MASMDHFETPADDVARAQRFYRDSEGNLIGLFDEVAPAPEA